jgi:hypothetical protein
VVVDLRNALAAGSGLETNGITPEAGVLERIGLLPPALSACLSIRLTSTL